MESITWTRSHVPRQRSFPGWLETLLPSTRSARHQPMAPRPCVEHICKSRSHSSSFTFTLVSFRSFSPPRFSVWTRRMSVPHSCSSSHAHQTHHQLPSTRRLIASPRVWPSTSHIITSASQHPIPSVLFTSDTFLFTGSPELRQHLKNLTTISTDDREYGSAAVL
jgi:hypothetical protein